jgi:hypothetical protein
MARQIMVEQTGDDGYDPVEVCEFRLPGDGTVELVTDDGLELLAFRDDVASSVEELARLVCEEVAGGDETIYCPEKDVILNDVE